MKRMIDQASFEKASSDIKEIQDVLSGKAFFDGSVTVVTIGGDKGIKKANLPITAGVYKLSSGGVLCVGVNSASSITLTAIYKDNMYAETRDPASTADLKFVEANRMGDKPIYCHPISISVSSPHQLRLTCLIFNNDPTPFTLTSLKEWFDNLVATTEQRAVLMVSGGVSTSISNKPLIASSLDKTLANNYAIIGIDVDGSITYFSNADWDVLFPPADSTLVDGVNRIN